MAFKGQLVLILARDFPFLRHEFAVLAHGKAGARLGNRRWLWQQFAGLEALEDFDFVHSGFGAREFGEARRQFRCHRNGRIGSGVRAHGDAAFDLSGGDLAGNAHGRLQRCPASLD